MTSEHRSSRGRPRQPAAITVDLGEIQALLPKLRRNYSTAYDFCYRPGGLPGAESGRGSSASFSDSTGDSALNAAKQHARRRTASAGRMVDQALSLLRAAADAVEAEAWPKDREGYTPVQVFGPALLTRAQYAESKEAAARRVERGDDG